MKNHAVAVTIQTAGGLRYYAGRLPTGRTRTAAALPGAKLLDTGRRETVATVYDLSRRYGAKNVTAHQIALHV